MSSYRTKTRFAVAAVACALVLFARTASADPIAVVVDKDGSGLVVTVNVPGVNVHFSYDQSCEDGKPCYSIEASQGMVGVAVSAPSCKVDDGTAYTPTGVQCPASATSIQFKLAAGGTWSAYAGGGGQHTGTTCSPARVIVTTGKGANSVNSWDGCTETIHCDLGPGDFAGVEVDASDEIDGKCSSVVKH